MGLQINVANKHDICFILFLGKMFSRNPQQMGVEKMDNELFEQ